VGNFIFLGLLELLIVVLFAIHLEHDKNVFSSHQEALSIVLGHSLLNVVVDHDFFVVSLVVFSVG
jgi:hypothetical protein